MSAHDLAPVNSILGIIYGILGLLNVSNSLAHIPSGACLILALIDAQQSLMHVLSNSIPSESDKDSCLVYSLTESSSGPIGAHCKLLFDCLSFFINFIELGWDYLCSLLDSSKLGSEHVSFLEWELG